MRAAPVLIGLQARLVVRNAFRTDADRSAARQKLARGDESLLVLCYVFAFVLPSIDRQRVERLNEVADDRHPKQWRFGQKRNSSRREAKQKHRIDQRVRMIQYKDDRRVAAGRVRDQ